MASIEAEVISAVVRNKDPHTVFGEDGLIYGATADVIDFIRQYYMRYRDVPTAEIIQEEFPDVELPETSGPTDFYIDRLKSSYIKGNMDFLLDRAQEDLEGGVAPAQILEKLNEKLTGLVKYTTKSHDVNMTDFEGAITHIEQERLRSEETGVPGIPTGFAGIDANYPTGFAAGNSIVLMGFSGRGKSFFSALLAVRAWKSGRKVLVVSLEMPPSEYRNRLYAMMSEGRFLISEMGSATASTDKIREWGQEELAKSPDFIVVGMDDAGEMTPNRIQAKIDMYQPDLVIVDYLQLMSDNRRTEGMTPRMLNLSREIKLMAMRNAVPIISITAVTDEENSKRESPPTLKQIAWSKGIEYDANLAIAVHKYPGTNIVEIVCRKNRIGEEFRFFFNVDFDRGVWTELYDVPGELEEKYA